MNIGLHIFMTLAKLCVLCPVLEIMKLLFFLIPHILKSYLMHANAICAYLIHLQYASLLHYKMNDCIFQMW